MCPGHTGQPSPQDQTPIPKVLFFSVGVPCVDQPHPSRKSFDPCTSTILEWIRFGWAQIQGGIITVMHHPSRDKPCPYKVRTPVEGLRQSLASRGISGVGGFGHTKGGVWRTLKFSSARGCGAIRDYRSLPRIGGRAPDWRRLAKWLQ